jgi:hypothetical protein
MLLLVQLQLLLVLAILRIEPFLMSLLLHIKEFSYVNSLSRCIFACMPLCLMQCPMLFRSEERPHLHTGGQQIC